MFQVWDEEEKIYEGTLTECLTIEARDELGTLYITKLNGERL